jgi:hypothetical protein
MSADAATTMVTAAAVDASAFDVAAVDEATSMVPSLGQLSRLMTIFIFAGTHTQPHTYQSQFPSVSICHILVRRNAAAGASLSW